MRRRTCSSASRSRWRRTASSSRSLHVERLEELDLVREGEVRRVTGAVRERARLGDRAQERADPLVGVAELEDLLHDRAVLGLELLHAAGARMVVGRLVHVDAQLPERVGLRGAEDAAVQAVEDDGVAAAGQPDALEHLGHRPDRRVVVLVPRHEQHPLLVADVDRERHRHVREDDGVFQGYEQIRLQDEVQLLYVVTTKIVATTAEANRAA